MENSNCGIAASADCTGRAGKIRYDIEMNREFQFFLRGTSFWHWKRVLILRFAPGTSNFCCRTGNLAKLARPRE